MLLYLHPKFGDILSKTYKDMTLYPNMYQNVYCNLLQKNLDSIEAWPLYKHLLLEEYCESFFIFRYHFKATKRSFQKGMLFVLGYI